jgi:hypothetical protein
MATHALEQLSALPQIIMRSVHVQSVSSAILSPTVTKSQFQKLNVLMIRTVQLTLPVSIEDVVRHAQKETRALQMLNVVSHIIDLCATVLRVGVVILKFNAINPNAEVTLNAPTINIV